MNRSNLEKTSIRYIVNARFPTERAHGYQIAQMCQAFMENGISLELWHPYRENTQELREKLSRNYYGLRVDIPQMELCSTDWHNSLGRCGNYASFLAHYIQSRTFYSGVTRKLGGEKGTEVIYLRDGDLAVWLMGRLPEIQGRMIIELHHLPRRSWRRERWAKSFEKACMIVALTHAMKAELMDLGISKERIYVSADAVDWETFDISNTQKEARAELNLPQDRKIAAYVGKFHTNEEEKGIPEIIQAAGILQKINPELDFYFIGGPMSRVPRYHEVADQHQAEKDRLIFHGKQPIQQVPLWLKAADILLMPHPKTEFYSKYVSPLKMFEYMAAGRPIVASKLPAIEEVLEDGKTAFMAKPGNASDIARVITKILSDFHNAEMVATAAKDRGCEYSWANRVRQIMSHYQLIK